jgi:hypothetical protein
VRTHTDSPGGLGRDDCCVESSFREPEVSNLEGRVTCLPTFFEPCG